MSVHLLVFAFRGCGCKRGDLAEVFVRLRPVAHDVDPGVPRGEDLLETAEEAEAVKHPRVIHGVVGSVQTAEVHWESTFQKLAEREFKGLFFCDTGRGLP